MTVYLNKVECRVLGSLISGIQALSKGEADQSTRERLFEGIFNDYRDLNTLQDSSVKISLGLKYKFDHLFEDKQEAWQTHARLIFESYQNHGGLYVQVTTNGTRREIPVCDLMATEGYKHQIDDYIAAKDQDGLRDFFVRITDQPFEPHLLNYSVVKSLKDLKILLVLIKHACLGEKLRNNHFLSILLYGIHTLPRDTQKLAWRNVFWALHACDPRVAENYKRRIPFAFLQDVKDVFGLPCDVMAALTFEVYKPIDLAPPLPEEPAFQKPASMPYNSISDITGLGGADPFESALALGSQIGGLGRMGYDLVSLTMLKGDPDRLYESLLELGDQESGLGGDWYDPAADYWANTVPAKSISDVGSELNPAEFDVKEALDDRNLDLAYQLLSKIKNQSIRDKWKEKIALAAFSSQR